LCGLATRFIIQAAPGLSRRRILKLGVEMAAIDSKAHWEQIHSSRGETGGSWYQSEPRRSLELIHSVSPPAHGLIIDVGAGASMLADRLLDLPFVRIAVLDTSETALDTIRPGKAPGGRADRVEWIVVDITEVESLGTFDVWHDRAVFHFLTDAADRRRYVEPARRTVPEGCHLIVAGFAEEGPKRCSDLDVCRYIAGTMAAELREGFAIVREAGETHTTPRGSPQAFFYGVFRRQ
jgi:hypothetical protein